MFKKSTFFAILFLTTFFSIATCCANTYFVSTNKDSLKYYDGQLFTVIGKFHSEKNYSRFPQNYKSILRNKVWELGQNSSGISIRFRSNASDITIRWNLKLDYYLPHMASTGVKGVDLYTFNNGTWQFIQTGRPKGKTTEYSLLQKGEPVFREYLLNLPLYDGIDSLLIGINADAEILVPKEQLLISKKPIVYYGSSIVQGACASRPGMAFTNILSRKLDRSIINLGFSGEGTFDESVGLAMCEIDAALYIIDCNPNTESEFIFDRAVKLVQQLKKCQPKIPILLVENYLFDDNFFMPDQRMDELKRRQELKRAFDYLKNSGITNICYQKGDNLIGNDHEATVDGVHPNDVGMQRIAAILLPQIQRLIKSE